MTGALPNSMVSIADIVRAGVNAMVAASNEWQNLIFIDIWFRLEVAFRYLPERHPG